jgi:probable phosphoglycerate mutase
MTIVLLIRHASNDVLKEQRLAGWMPGVHINAEGQREADSLAQRLAHLQIHAIYSSPLERAMDTAQAVAACQKLDVQIREDIGEMRAGEWEGKKISEVNETEIFKKLQKSPVGVHLPGGESIDEVQTRMVAAVDAIVAAHPNQMVAIVSHADPLKAALAHYLAMDLNQFQRIAISPASVSIVLFGENGPVVLKVNDTAKLPMLKPEPEKKDDKKEDERKEQAMPEANVLHDLNPVTHITAGAVGAPGKRTFYLQGRQGTQVITLAAEKEQIAALSTGIDQLLERLGTGSATVDVTAMQMELSQPIEPLFRVGQLGLGYDADRSLIVIVAYAVPEEENQQTIDVVRFWATREQMRGLARHAAAIVAGGRPVCVLCGRPIDPEGHFCPKRNGHGQRASLT